MKILVINGSPRRESGNTERILSAISASAAENGNEISVMYLADEDPEYCTACGHGCFADGSCALEEGATTRSLRIRDADALLIGAPVYCWQPNALTCTLFDKFRIPHGTWVDDSTPGIRAMGIAVAGGTGTGVFPALQSMYAWLCAWRFSPTDPVPVTRYNLDRVIGRADELALALTRKQEPAFNARWNHMHLFDQLPYMSFGRIDEYEWLAHRMIEYLADAGSNLMERREAHEFLDRAVTAEKELNREERARLVMSAFDCVFSLCR
jgi:multimeric flavodoxin WrbA